MQDVRYQLHDDKEDQHGYQLLQTQLSHVEKLQEEGRAVLPFLEAYLLSLTCDDPGTIIGPQLVLSLLQERLDAKAQEHHQQKLNQKKQEVASLLYPAFAVMCQILLICSKPGSAQSICHLHCHVGGHES